METIHITPAGQGEHFLVLGDVATIKAAGQGTSGRILVLENVVPPGGGPPALHRHDYAEVFYFLEGEFELSTADDTYAVRTVIVKAGDMLSIPSMVWHNFKNVGATPGKFIVIHSPAVMEEFIREIGQPVADPLNPPKPSGPPSDEQLQQIMGMIGKYMEMLPPDKLVREKIS
jgi:mannose-6-phosphate isomerase-like protein (cupin superfamily)